MTFCRYCLLGRLGIFFAASLVAFFAASLVTLFAASLVTFFAASLVTLFAASLIGLLAALAVAKGFTIFAVVGLAGGVGASALVSAFMLVGSSSGTLSLVFSSCSLTLVAATSGHANGKNCSKS